MIIRSKSYERYALLMILGGALGNLFDRIIYKGVPDFIDFHIDDFHWFIFNVSDIFITIGVILMIFFEGLFCLLRLILFQFFPYCQYTLHLR